jgi:hypothetical protein
VVVERRHDDSGEWRRLFHGGRALEQGRKLKSGVERCGEGQGVVLAFYRGWRSTWELVAGEK